MSKRKGIVAGMCPSILGFGVDISSAGLRQCARCAGT
jgi:hypothetical protein